MINYTQYRFLCNLYTALMLKVTLNIFSHFFHFFLFCLNQKRDREKEGERRVLYISNYYNFYVR